MADDPDLQPVLSQDREPIQEEQVRYRWLVLLALFGSAIVVGSIYWNVFRHRDDILPSVLLEVGAGMLLFVVLFGVERVVVRKTIRLETEKLYRAMSTVNSSESQEVEDAIVEQAVKLGVSPFDSAHQWLEAAVDSDYEELWDLSDTSWQLCRAQAWVWNNRHPKFLDLDESACVQLADELAQGPGVSSYWGDFARIEAEQFQEAYQGVEPGEWGVGSQRRVVAPGYEVVNLIPLGQYRKGLLITRPLWVRNGLRFLYRWNGEKWVLASHTADAPPTPGLPPSWWAADSVPDDALHFAGYA